MTSVIGILNKKGIALAADSAVTRTRSYNNKVTKNGNKMIRLSDVLPICVMLTGNGDFMRTQWDILVRHYRQHRGKIMHATVEACMHDFFRYIADHGLFRDPEYAKNRVRSELESFFNHIENFIDDKYKNRGKDGAITSPRAFQKAFVNELNGWCKRWLKDGVCPQFHDYTQQNFHEYTKEIFDEYIEQNCYDEDDVFKYGLYPRQILSDLREPLEKSLMIRLTTRRDDDDAMAELVFSGYGEQQEYPSLVSTVVCEGFDNRVNYHVRPTDIICISDERPTAICPFAQKDVIHSVLRGIHRNFSRQLTNAVKDSFTPQGNDIFIPGEDDNVDFMDFAEKLDEVKTDDLSRNFFRKINRLLDSNLHQLEKALEDYDLQSMAALAESLIDLTGFHRILTFQQEGVGGPVDVAVISKNDGFTWLNRKSWYHHKDVGGRYGKLGV
jgi:hypothetical protein